MLGAEIAAAVVALAAAGALVARRGIFGANGYWTAGCVAIFASGTFGFLFPDAPSIVPLAYAFGTAYPSLLLAGALAFAGKRVPSWLLPAAVAAGALRGVLGVQGAVEASQWLSVATEPTVSFTAAIVVLLAIRRRASTLAERALVPGLLAIAALDAATTLANPPGMTLPPAYLELWALGVPLLLAL